MSIENSPEAVVEELSRELAYNYFSNSYSDDNLMQIADYGAIFADTEIQKKFKLRGDKGERVRNILVVGAGACFDAYKANPTGQCLIEEVREYFETRIKEIDFLKQKFIEQEEEIKDVTGEDKLNFENYLYLLSKLFVSQKTLRERIKEMTGFRYSVSLFNEIVAHLLKHAFVDVVINFNFEETLDQMIKQEVGEGNYHNIISDGNCVDLKDILVDGRLKMPIYIKPHGTFSHKSTLRFTNKHYFDLPNDLQIMLEQIISGKSGKKEIQRVNLIVVGFAMDSIEFNKILGDYLPPKSVIYHLDYKPCGNAEAFFEKRKYFKKFILRAARAGIKKDDLYKPCPTEKMVQNDIIKLTEAQIDKIKKDFPPLSKTQERKLFDKTPSLKPKEYQVTTLPYFVTKEHEEKNKNINFLSTTFGQLFTEIWRLQNNYFSQPFKPRSIARHEITSYLFYIPELGLDILKGKKLTLNEWVNEREFIYDFIETHPKHFRNRVLIELFLLLNRNNGILDIAQILKGRVGLFYNKYVECCENRPNTIRGIHTVQELLDVFTKPGQNVTAKDLLSKKEYRYGKNLFVLDNEFTEKAIENENFVDELLKKTGHFDKLHLSFKGVPIPVTSHMTDKEHEDLIDAFKNNLESLITVWHKKNRNNQAEILKFNRSFTLFYRLMVSDLTSNFFKFNFLLNHDKIVYNGNPGPSEFVINGRRTMISEIFRLLSKSINHHYFVIEPVPRNPVHRMWESFSRRKLIHTNLGRTAEFNHMFLKKEWNTFLAVTETGGLLNVLNYYAENNTAEMRKKLEGKQFIIICSHEAIRQFHPVKQEHESIQELIKKHAERLRVKAKDGEYLISENNLTVLVMPFNQHNHHISMFLQSMPLNLPLYNLSDHTILEPNVDEMSELPRKYSYFFDAIGSIYFYRSGFSNSIDPLYIGCGFQETSTDHLYRDQVKLADAFVGHLDRAFKFEYFARKSSGQEKVWKKPNFLQALQKISDKEENGVKRDDLFNELYKEVNK